MKYNFSTNSKKYFLYPILGWIIFSLFPLLFISSGEINKILKIFLLAFVVWGLFFGFSVLYLMINHYNQSKNVRIQIERLFHGDYKITYSKKNILKEIFRTDIEKCIVYKGQSIFVEKYQRFGYQFEIYFYKIILTDGTQINISCAICDELDKYISSDKLIYNKKWLAIM